MTLAGLLTLVLPALVYSHVLSGSYTVSEYSAVPVSVSTWVGFNDSVNAFVASLDDTNARYDPVAFPTEEGGAYETEVTPTPCTCCQQHVSCSSTKSGS